MVKQKKPKSLGKVSIPVTPGIMRCGIITIKPDKAQELGLAHRRPTLVSVDGQTVLTAWKFANIRLADRATVHAYLLKKAKVGDTVEVEFSDNHDVKISIKKRRKPHETD